MYKRCQTCGNWAELSRHHCPPLWECVEPDSEYRRTIYAYDAQQAVEKFAEQIDPELDYCIVGDSGDGDETEVVVIDSNGNEKYFLVSAEHEIKYSAREKENSK